LYRGLRKARLRVEEGLAGELRYSYWRGESKRFTR
jgi:hypothetical protein